MDKAPEELDKWREIERIVYQSERTAVAGQFASAILREINGPLEAAVNLNYLIQLDSANSQQVRQYSKLMEEQLMHLARLARQTLSYYRSPETVEAVAIGTLADAALRVHHQKIDAKKIRLIKSVPGDVTVEAHPGDLLQVMSNLIANAIDALPHHGTLRLKARRGSNEVHILVADDGHGIPDEISREIFNPFFTTKKERGTGLGLAISKAIVEKHHGRIRSRSSVRPGRSGTAFRISLPVEPSSSHAHKS